MAGMKQQRYKFDLLTQRFIVNRWDTDIGRKLHAEIVERIKTSADISPLLDHYVLEHPDNIEPYDYPIYPHDSIIPGAFWVLDAEDMRGIRFHQENFCASASLTKMQLSLSGFYRCNLRHAQLGMSRISFTNFEGCDLREAMFAHAEGLDINFSDSDMRDCCLLGAEMIGADLSGCDCRGIYLGEAKLQQLVVDYRSRFDPQLKRSWQNRSMAPRQLADLYHSLRLAYQRADLWHIADRYLLQERTASRKHIRWPEIVKHTSFRKIWMWLKDWIWGWTAGYGTRPGRLVALGILVSLTYAMLYAVAGGLDPESGKNHDFASALYFSFTTFATLGYGDLSYGPEHPWLRLLSTTEAWAGAIIIALFVAVMARKILR